VLTPNRRLARRLHQEVARRRVAAGQAVWETPEILTWSAWLRRAWDDPCCGTRPALLSATQAAALWETVVADGGTELLLPGGAAATAAEAWKLLHGWRIDPGDPAFGENGDSRAFRRWAHAYLDRCNTAGWIDDARLSDAVAARFADGRLRPPERLAFYAFDELAPQQQALLDVLASAGCEVASFAPEPAPGRVRCTALSTFDDELHAAASWARTELVADSELRIGIVVPDLAVTRGQVAHTFDAVLAPERLLVDGLAVIPPFELSLGASLAEQPPVHAALRLLELLLAGPHPFPLVSGVLRSPHLAGAVTEADARACAELVLRDAGRADWHLDAVFLQLRSKAPDFVKRLAAARDALDPGISHEGSSRMPGDWSVRVSAALEAAGWPGETSLDSGNFQAVTAFHDLLADLARLDAVVPPERAGRLHTRLGRLARERVFQPAGGRAQVEVLGLLEAAGQRYDRLWVCGLDDAAWPPPARPNPFIPARLRREYDLPRSSPEREALVAGRQTAAFAVAADEVIFSHAVRDGDTGLAASPLLQAYDNVALTDIVPELAPWPAVVVADVALESFDDRRAPPVPGGLLKGGTRRIADQSACPFRAFAHHRLRADPLDSPPRGLDAMTRGNLVHKVLQSLWKKEGAGVARLSDERRRALVTLASARAIDGIEQRLGDRRKLRAIEQDRLVALVEGWLDIDRELPPGRRSEVEMDLTHHVGDHAIRLRIDRLDTLDDGRLAVIDYKTGTRLPHSDWGEARPREPQLPFYAAALGAERVAALAFGKVHVEGCGYSGLATEEGLLPGLKAKEGAGETIIAAAEAAEALLSDHVAGNAAVDPTDRACDYCGLEALCRVHEGDGVATESDDA